VVKLERKCVQRNKENGVAVHVLVPFNHLYLFHQKRANRGYGVGKGAGTTRGKPLGSREPITIIPAPAESRLGPIREGAR
jgi:hypothetical protein